MLRSARSQCFSSARPWRLPLLLASLIAAPSVAGASSPLVTLAPPVGEPVHLDLGMFEDGVLVPPDLADDGYVEEEFFLEGTAEAYVNTAPLLADGHWAAEPSGTTAPYKVRMLVHRPADLKDFNGTVFVEWLNVSAGAEYGPVWQFAREEFVRRGYVYVGVGVQWVGIENPLPPVPIPGSRGGLKLEQPVRYASLSHPGDSFSYDIFTQAAEALRSPDGPDPLGNLRPKLRELIATGQSQGAGRLRAYINAVQPLADVYDGFLPVAGTGASALSQSVAANWPGAGPIPTPDIPSPSPTDVREIPGVPVLAFQTETEIAGLAPTGFSHRPDSPWYRQWEVTGTAHIDAFGAGFGPRELTAFFCGPPETTVPLNAGPQRWALHAAARYLRLWVRSGIAAPSGDRMEVAGGAVVRDPDTGLAEGGIRLPDIAVPTRTLTGVRGAGGNLFCSLFGRTDPWNGDGDPWDGTAEDPSPTPEPDLQELYPTRTDFVKKFVGATLVSLVKGHIVWEDLSDFFRYALTADIGEE